MTVLRGDDVLAATGDGSTGLAGVIARFPCAKKLVRYAGWGQASHDSGKMHCTGRITKQGRRELRWVVVWHMLTECATDRKADEEMVALKLMMRIAERSVGRKLGQER